MAQSLDWNKASLRAKINKPLDYTDENTYTISDVINHWSNTKWPLKGKYKNKKLKDLSLDYLGWIIDNFDPDSQPYKLAKQELECRYKTALKVGGPDR